MSNNTVLELISSSSKNNNDDEWPSAETSEATSDDDSSEESGGDAPAAMYLDSRLVFAEIGGLDALVAFFNRFYQLLFADADLATFVTDQNEPHGERFAHWLAEKMSGEPLWSRDLGREGMRSPSHAKAWACPHRAEARRGDRFKVHDCRQWMRLNFLALRETGLHKSANFCKWYRAFIFHFIAVYERKAPAYVGEAWQWARNKRAVARYVASGEPRHFTDIPMPFFR